MNAGFLNCMAHADGMQARIRLTAAGAGSRRDGTEETYRWQPRALQVRTT